MADNKAKALKEANKQYQLKIYYDGDGPVDSGYTIIENALEPKQRPWVIKYYMKNGIAHQFADTAGIFNRILQDLSSVLDAVIVNAKQREALGKIIRNMLASYLYEDMAHEGDLIADPGEY